MLTEDEIFANLERALRGESTNTTKTTNSTPAIPDRLEITPNAVSLITFNYFDNGAEKRVTWTNARYVMNLQIFDITQPFTPSSDIALHDFSVQMHSIEFFSRYLEARHPAQLAAYKDIVQDTYSKVQVYPDMLIGQPFSKRHGTSYAWGTILKTWTDDLGEFAAELLIDGTSFRDQGFAPPPPRKNQGGTPPVGLSKWDPHGLWRTKNPKFARRKA